MDYILQSDKLARLSSGPLRFSWWSTCSGAEIGGSCSSSLVQVPAFIPEDDKSLDTLLMKLVMSNACLLSFGTILSLSAINYV